MTAAQGREGTREAGLTGSLELPIGVFTYRTGDDRVTWSQTLSALFGFGPGEAVATLALLTTHQHPDDRAGWDHALHRVGQGGRAVALWHRILSDTGTPRTLHTVLSSHVDDSGATTVRGVVSDLTRRVRQDRADEAARAVAEATRTRTTIDQAKGVLMGVFNINDVQAFDLLRWHSSRSNVKLRDIAALIVDRLPDPEAELETPRRRLMKLLVDIGSTHAAAPLKPDYPIRAVQPTASDTTTQAVTTRHIPAERLAQTMVLAAAAAAHSVTIADCTAPDEPLVYVNPAFERSTGYTAAEVLGRNCRLLQGPDTDREQTGAVARAIRAGETVRTVLLNYRKDGTPFWNELLLAPVHDDDGRLTHYVGYQSDVSERIEREHQLERLAYHDPTTGLPNQAAALRHLDTAIATNPDSRHALIHLRFDPIDDERDSTFEAGRTPPLVHAAALQLHASLPANAVLTRADGDALCVLLFEPVDGQAEQVSAEVAQQLNRYFSRGLGAPLATVRCGQAAYPLDTTDPATLLRLVASRTRHVPPSH